MWWMWSIELIALLNHASFEFWDLLSHSTSFNRVLCWFACIQSKRRRTPIPAWKLLIAASWRLDGLEKGQDWLLEFHRTSWTTAGECSSTEKYNHIYIYIHIHIYIYIWLYGYMVIWLYGYMVIWFIALWCYIVMLEVTFVDAIRGSQPTEVTSPLWNTPMSRYASPAGPFGGFLKWRYPVPPNGWFTMGNPIRIDDLWVLWVPPFQETSI